MNERDDDLLMKLIADTIADKDAPPSRLETRAKESHRLVLAEAELADIEADSFESSGVRAGSSVAPRMRYRAQEVTFDIELSNNALFGQVQPVPESREVGVETPDSLEVVSTDAGGVFHLQHVPRGPVRFHADVGRPVVTQWDVLRASDD